MITALDLRAGMAVVGVALGGLAIGGAVSLATAPLTPHLAIVRNVHAANGLPAGAAAGPAPVVAADGRP